MRQISMKAARVDAGLTIVDMSKQIGVCTNLIVDWERGRKPVPKEHFERFCNACGRPTADVRANVILVTSV